jgi:tetraacyldisaccharide 4'-kinase
LSLNSWLQRVWYEDAPSGSILRPLSWLFRGLVAFRRRLYRLGLLSSHAVGRPVVVIGNLTVGGTGKTPFALWLAGRLRERGVKVGVVLRGYRGHADNPCVVTADASYEDVGDEALLLARRGACPVAIGADRVAAARLLVAAGVELILADDGLQHLALRRDLEIVVVDGERRFGNGRLLPAGPLREPVDRLATVDAVVVNGASEESLTKGREQYSPAERGVMSCVSMSMRPDAAISIADGARRALATFAASQAHAVAAIGNPERFFRMLEGAGIRIIRHPLPDHYALRSGDIDFNDDLPVLMTEKDAVKCRDFAGPRHWYVPVDAVLNDADERELLGRVLGVMRSAA